MDSGTEEKLQRSNPRCSVISSCCSVDFHAAAWICSYGTSSSPFCHIVALDSPCYNVNVEA